MRELRIKKKGVTEFLKYFFLWWRRSGIIIGCSCLQQNFYKKCIFLTSFKKAINININTPSVDYDYWLTSLSIVSLEPTH